MANFENMGKVELRAACRAAGIVYGKMNNTEMRAALAGLNKATADISAAAPVVDPVPAAPSVQEAVAVAIEEKSDKELDSVSVLSTPAETQTVAASDVGSLPASLTYTLPPSVVEAPAAPARTGTKIQKDRPEQNGVKRPSEGTICAQIWQALDNARNDSKTVPSFKDLKALQEKNGWARNTAVTQYQRWKEFNGLMVR